MSSDIFIGFLTYSSTNNISALYVLCFVSFVSTQILVWLGSRFLHHERFKICGTRMGKQVGRAFRRENEKVLRHGIRIKRNIAINNRYFWVRLSLIFGGRVGFNRCPNIVLKNKVDEAIKKTVFKCVFVAL